MNTAIERGIIPPSRTDIEAANNAALWPESLLISWAKRLGPPILASTGLVIACAPQEVNKPAIVEPAKPTATVTAIPGIGGSEPLATVAPGYPNAKELNDIIKRLNDPSTAGSVSQEEKNMVTLVISVPAQGTATAEAPTPEAVDISKCVFIKDPVICVQGQPRTRPGYEDQITGVEYNDIQGTPINTRAGYFSVAKDNETQKIVGVSINFVDGSTINIRADDLDIANKNSREVKDNEVVAKVGNSGYVSFSTGANIDFQTGKATVPQSFFINNFPKEVTQKSKKLVQSTGGGPNVVVTTKFED